MGKPHSISVVLPDEMAQLVKDKVASDEYASESEVIQSGLLALQARDELEDWLRDEMAPAYDAMNGDPSRGYSSADVRASLAGEHERATKAR